MGYPSLVPDNDAFDRWVKEFSGEVDASLKAAPEPALSSPEARQAQKAFDQWWEQEQQPVLDTAPLRLDDPPPPAASRPAEETARRRLLPEEWPERLEKLADERARLEQRSESAERETRALRERLSTVQSEIAEFEARLSRSRQGYEEHIQRLDSQTRLLEEQLRGLREDKGFLESALRRAQEEAAASAQAASLERARADAAERGLLEQRKRAEEQDKELARLRQELAASIGACEELRRQASVYQHRLVQSKELTDADIMTMRQDLKVFLEELRLIRGSIRKGE